MIRKSPIQHKERPCKGMGQAKGYGCGKLTMHRQYGLGKMCCYPKWLLESDAGKAKMKKALIKVQQPRVDLERAEKERQTLSDLNKALKHTKVVVHEYIRHRDKGKPCISCNEAWRPEFQAGHFFKAELYETLKFNLHNINGQCPRCNLFKEGNIDKYSINLPKRIGREAFEALKELAEVDKHFVKVWNVESLKAIREQVKKLMKDL